MLFLLFPKDKLNTLLELLSHNIIIGPIRKAVSPSSEIQYDYEPLYDHADLVLHHSVTAHFSKEYFLPHKQAMGRYDLDGSSWVRRVDHDITAPVVFLEMVLCRSLTRSQR